MKSKNKRLLFIIIPIIIIIIFSDVFIKNHGIYIFHGDSYEQIYQFYIGGWERIKSGTLSQFEWSLGVGGNIMSYVYYFLTSPFFYITLLFPKEWIKYLFLILGMFKILILFFTSYYWTGKLTQNFSSRLIDSFAITFSGWVFEYFTYSMFLDAFILYPLILGFLEDFLTKHKIVPFVLGLGILGIINFYFLYMFIPFSCLYALIRYLIIHKCDFKLINMLKEGIIFIGLVLLGVGISSIVILPCANLILNNNRFDGTQISLTQTIGIKELLYFFSSLYSPIFDRYDPSVFVPVYQHQFIGWNGGCSLFSLVITPLLLPLIFTIKDHWKKYSIFSGYLLLGLFTFFQFFWFLFQRTIDTRWMYMILFYNAMTIIFVNDDLNNYIIPRRNLIISWIFYFISICSLTFILIKGEYYPETKLIYILLIICFELCIAAFYVFYYSFKIRKIIILMILLCLESIVYGRIYVHFNNSIEYSFFNQNEFGTEPIDYIRSIDDGFYRILYSDESYVIHEGENPTYITTANEPFAKNYPGFSFYNTVLNPETIEFNHRFGGTWHISEPSGRNKLYTLMSAKYWITYDYEKPVPDNYYKIMENKEKGFSIYRNPYYIPLGKTYTKTINKEYFLTLPYYIQDLVMQEYLVTETSENTEINSSFELVYLGQLLDSDYRELTLEKPISNCNVIIANYGILDLDISLYYENNLINSQHYSQFNYIDFKLDENTLVDKIVVSGKNDSGVPVLMDVFYENNTDAYKKWYDELQEEQFQNIYFKGSHIEADIEVKDDRNVFISVPYDRGWTMKLNGEKAKFDKVNLSFIGFHLEQGKYHIELDYHIPGLVPGIILSISSLIILFLIAWKINNKKS